MYEAIPSAEWQELYIGIRSEDPAECEQAVQAIVRGATFQMSPDEFVALDSVEPFSHPDGGTIWVDLAQNRYVLSQVADRVRFAIAQSRRPYPADNPDGRWISSIVNQVVSSPPIEGWWDIPQRCLCNIPILGIWDKE